MKHLPIAICTAMFAAVIGCASVPKEDRVATALLLADTSVATLEAIITEFRDADDPSEDIARFIRVYNVLKPTIVAALELLSSSSRDVEQEQQFQTVVNRYRAVSGVYTTYERDLALSIETNPTEPIITLEPLEP